MAKPGTITSQRKTLFNWLFWFFTAETVVLLIISLRYQSATTSIESTSAGVFSVLMHVGHFASWTLATMILICIFAALFPRPWFITGLSVILTISLNILVLVDTYVYQLYRFHLNGSVLGLLFGDASGDIFVFSPVMYFQISLIVAGIILLGFALSSLAWRLTRITNSMRAQAWIISTLIMVILAQNGIYAWADAASYTPIIRQAGLLPAYLPTTMRRFLRERGIDTSSRAAEFLQHGSVLAYPLKPVMCQPPTNPLNILFIVIDSWRFDTLTPQITPNIYNLSKNGFIFTEHSSGGSSTRTGMFSLFYGLPATYWNEFLVERRGPLLISEVLRQDYQTGIFGSARLTSPEFDRTIFSDIAGLRLQSDGTTTVEHDRDITADFIEYVHNLSLEKPFFSVLFYDAPHSFALPNDWPLKFHPSLESVNYLALGPNYDAKAFFNRYLNSINFVDALVSEALAAVETRGLLKNTIIIVSSDHGQEFNETGLNFWGHNGNFSRYQIGVPLVISWPGRAGRTYTHRTSHFDIVPTLMQEVLGCGSDAENYSVGRNLFDTRNPELLLLANYEQNAVVESDRITVMQSYGLMEILDHAYRPLTDAVPRTNIMRLALEQQTRFMGRPL